MRFIFALLLVLAGLTIMPATATAQNCGGTTTIGVGGFNNGSGTVFPPGSVDRRAVYSGNLNDIQGGIDALAREVSSARAVCPRDRLILSGHSQGAAVVHVFLTRGMAPGNSVAVLYADPKQIGTGESDFSFALGGYPIAGTDANFAGVPTVSICNRDDVICNRGAGWFGYLFTNAHGAYDFQPRWYAGRVGIIWYH